MFPLETLPTPRRSECWSSLPADCFVSRASTPHVFLNGIFLQRGVVSTSPNPQAGGPTLVGCSRLLIQFIRSHPPYRRPFLYPQPENAPCRGDRDPLLLHCNAFRRYTLKGRHAWGGGLKIVHIKLKQLYLQKDVRCKFPIPLFCVKLFVSWYEVTLVIGVTGNKWHKGKPDAVRGYVDVQWQPHWELGPAESFVLRFGLIEQNISVLGIHSH